MNKSFVKSALYAMLSTFLIVNLGHAQQAKDVVRPFIGFDGTGSRAAGLGGAFSGVADDFSALYYNPAGLANITWAEATIGGTYYTLKNSFTTEGSVTQKNTVSRNYVHTNSLAYVWPAVGMQFSIGLGYHNVSMMDRAFRITGRSGSTQYTANTNEESGLGAYTIGLGYQLQKEFSFGVSFHLYSGSSKYSSEANVRTTSLDSTLQYTIDDRFSGIGGTVGFLFAPTNYLRTGLSFSIPKFINVNEDYQEFDTNYHFRHSYNYQYQSPPELRLGQSVNIKGLLLSGSLIWRDWSLTRFHESNVDQPIEVDINNTLRQDYKSTVEYAVGAEYLLPVANVKIRGGLHYVPSYIKGNSVSSRTVYSGGASVVLAQQFKIDLAYNTANWTENYTNIFPAINGQADITNALVSINLSYRF